MNNNPQQEQQQQSPNPKINYLHPRLLTQLEHRLDIAPSPSPPPHLLQTYHHHHQSTSTQQSPSHLSSSSSFSTDQQHHHQQQSDPTTQSNSISSPTHPTRPSQPSLDPSTQSPLHKLHQHISPELIQSPLLEPHPINMRPPPPPKKRDRIATDQSVNQHHPINTKRPTKKEKPAPVTMVYRGVPDELLIRNHALNPSITALAPQTIINRAQQAHPPSTIAPSYSLSHATEASLMRKKHNRLLELCRERNLLSETHELTKREMVQALLGWREYNINHRISMLLSETEDSSMTSESDDQHHSFFAHHPSAHTAETSIDDAIDPQLCSPENNQPILYNLRNRLIEKDETIKSSSPKTRSPMPIGFSPQSQLADYLAATGIDAAPGPVPVIEVMQHPPTIPLLDDPTHSNSKRKSIRLVGTKIASIGPISKINMSEVIIGGTQGPTRLLNDTPITVKMDPIKTLGPRPSPLSPPASVDTHPNQSTHTEDEDPNQSEPTHSPTAGDDLDVLLDLEDLKLSDKEIPPEKLAREQKVGSGSFKDVYMGRYRNFRVAICDLRGRLTDMDIKELGLLRDLRHPNIVRFIGVSVGGHVPCTIVTELCRNGDLYDYIRKIPCPPFVQILAMMLDAARGVEYLHQRTPSIIHRDLKSPNVLITANGSAKITDFGLARVKRDVMSMCATTCGTLNWQAPELWVAHPSYNHSIDVYALGLVFWEVLCWSFKEKTYPFQGMNEHAIFAEVGKNGLRPSTSQIRRKWGREIVGLIEKMWDDDSEKRPLMPEVVRFLSAMLLQEREKSWVVSGTTGSVSGGSMDGHGQIRMGC
ncbi:kinase-like domain-containing protein [Melampsora americana]|nr:kinase-like domain-containing protein [Melampsora americana]